MKPSISSLVDLKAYFYITNCLIALNYALKYIYMLSFSCLLIHMRIRVNPQNSINQKEKNKKRRFNGFLLS